MATISGGSFAGPISAYQIEKSKGYESLELGIAGSADKLTVRYFFRGTTRRIPATLYSR